MLLFSWYTELSVKFHWKMFLRVFYTHLFARFSIYVPLCERNAPWERFHFLITFVTFNIVAMNCLEFLVNSSWKISSIVNDKRWHVGFVSFLVRVVKIRDESICGVNDDDDSPYTWRRDFWLYSASVLTI